MTKTIVIGEKSKISVKKPIVFTKILNEDLGVCDANGVSPADFNFIELICKDYNSDGDDLMFAYHVAELRHDGTLFVGKWNDGVV